METNALDYAFAVIFSIVNEENEVHLVAFHSYTFTILELNYNTYNKKLLLSLTKILLSSEYESESETSMGSTLLYTLHYCHSHHHHCYHHHLSTLPLLTTI